MMRRKRMPRITAAQPKINPWTAGLRCRPR
jgi:hypothetical protein